MKRIFFFVSSFFGCAGFAIGFLTVSRLIPAPVAVAPILATTDAVALTQAHPSQPTAQPAAAAGTVPMRDMTIQQAMQPRRLDSSNNSSESQNEYSRLYTRLGLQNSDTIRAVNGQSAPEGFLQLLPGFKAGHLCVRYERIGQIREVCFQRDQAGAERVTDGPSA